MINDTGSDAFNLFYSEAMTCFIGTAGEPIREIQVC